MTQGSTVPGSVTAATPVETVTATAGTLTAAAATTSGQLDGGAG